MGTDTFDRLALVLGAAPPRRALLRLFAAFTLGGVVMVDGRDASAKKCAPCKKKKKGKCKKNRANDTLCEETGLCLKGACNQPPTCDPAFFIACFGDDDCCSNDCQGLFPNSQCGRGGKGSECFSDNDCLSNDCVGFRCQ